MKTVFAYAKSDFQNLAEFETFCKKAFGTLFILQKPKMFEGEERWNITIQNVSNIAIFRLGEIHAITGVKQSPVHIVTYNNESE